VPIVRPVTSLAPYGKLTSAQVRDAILRGGTNIDWQMREETPGVIMGTVTPRGHSVTVEIPYDEGQYTIKYHSSVNMKAEKGYIHRNYNRWIDRLNRNIVAEIRKINHK
jgi:hypothetical protein